MPETSIETKVAMLQKDVDNIKEIHSRLDNAISKISDVTSAINRMLAVHEEKLSAQEDALGESEKILESRRVEFASSVSELHDRITKTTAKLSNEMAEQHHKNEKLLEEMKTEVVGKVNELEKFRWIIFGGISVLAAIGSIIASLKAV